MKKFSYKELYRRYQSLLEENTKLRDKINMLEFNSGILQVESTSVEDLPFEETSMDICENIPRIESIETEAEAEPLNNFSDTKNKIILFMSLFKGREDVYAKRWQDKKGVSGYSPVCLNEWKPGVCAKPKIKCSKCTQKLYAQLNVNTVEEHLRGKSVIGIYPMFPDETCFFLVIDFDDDEWGKDVSVIRDVCRKFEIPIAVERSRSGDGAHAWFFFEDRVSAALVRKFGTSLLTYSMNKRHAISFKSYDRFFPNQDTMPKGGFGNLIALPLQMSARQNGNSVFVDGKFDPYADQWEFLAGIQRLSETNLTCLITRLCAGNELGTLKKDDVEVDTPWVPTPVKLRKEDVPDNVKIVKSGMHYIWKTGFSSRALNALKRLAAFRNPDFYKSQAMRMPTYNKPRVISCSDDLEKYLCLPRGCEDDVRNLLNEYNVDANWIDETNHGKAIDVEFNGALRDEQRSAVDELIRYENGVLSATTAFGKTVVGASLIAERKVSTLILVHRQQLLSQWMTRLSEFLIINEQLPEQPEKRGRKRKQSLIGQLGAGKDRLSGIIDVAIMQSLNTAGEVKESVKKYGMIIVDECHHIPAFRFEQIVKESNAKFIYGLTATPERQDGHHPIIFLYCGPIRFTVDAKKQAEKMPFDHYVIPRFSYFRISAGKNEKELTIQEIYSELIEDEIRNQVIVDDVVSCYENGRNSLILTERTAHVKSLTNKLRERIPDVIALVGSMGVKETREIFERISATPANKPLTLVATGKYVGEGFDEPRLDTLFLAMPVSWKGTLQQYAGRLHRVYENKNEIRIYDYVDIQVRILEKMYGRRLGGYASIGYRAKGEIVTEIPTEIIFDKHSFFPVYTSDIVNAAREVLIVSPFVTNRRVPRMMQYFHTILKNKVKVTVMTRPAEDFKDTRRSHLVQIFNALKETGINVLFKSNIHQKFAIIDQKIVWYGSINLLSFGTAEESIMRLVSGNIAHELTKSIEKYP
ncbi:MAG: DEAD/DEAH box helicase family protein [Candidatus Scalindua sp.]|nr:DEAD/DEAH box helicase family protein [Candidatus Scalindua sp.]